MPKLLSRDFIEGPAFAVLNEFIGLFRSDGGFARPNRYEVILSAPNGFRGGGSIPNASSNLNGMKSAGDDRKASIRCQSISFPGRNLDTVEDTNIYGPTRQIVQGYSYGEVTGTFLCSNEHQEKGVFESWQNLAFDDTKTWSLGYYDNYVGQIDIYQLDEKDNRRAGVKLVECFPKTIAEQALAYGTNDTITTVDVTFTYRYWTNLATQQLNSGSSITDRLSEIAVNTIERKITSQIPKLLRRL